MVTEVSQVKIQLISKKKLKAYSAQLKIMRGLRLNALSSFIARINDYPFYRASHVMMMLYKWCQLIN